MQTLCQAIEPGSNYNDPAVRARVADAAAKRLRDGWKEDQFSSEQQSVRGKQRRGWRKQTPANDKLTGIPVQVWTTGVVPLTIKTTDGTLFDFELRGPPAAVKDHMDDVRQVTASEHGINLVEESGTIFKFKPTDLATWSKSFMARHQHSTVLIHIWTNTTGQRFQTDAPPASALPGGPLTLPVEFYGDVSEHTTFSRSRRPLRSAAPEPNEPDWLIWLFLQQEFDSGAGRLFLCRPEHEDLWTGRLPLGTIMLRSGLQDFANRPEYQHYPFKTQWLALLTASGASHTEATKKILSSLGIAAGLRDGPMLSSPASAPTLWPMGYLLQGGLKLGDPGLWTETIIDNIICEKAEENRMAL
ncbi:unnamed protein product [Tilletia controversa]|nr:unnamed protein product [Tilletia controversa]